jgi:GDP/UDP-N,N'-diacetylbacillosamine 2-epimerase (hydrolysing)
MKKTVCVVTGSRAEYGLFHSLLKEIKKAPMFQLQIVVTGMHLSSMYGLTYREILRDGFKIDENVKIPLADDTPEGITRSLGKGVIGFASAFKRLKPDLVVLLGDRFETYSAAIAAFVARIPIAHLHGGELTEGAVDDAFRHSITKMSFLHFTSTRAYMHRVIQLGEDPCRVFNVGALGVENIRRTKLFSKKALEKELGFDLNGKVALVTFHPVTLEHNASKQQFNQILSALDDFKNLKVVFTKPNSDTNGKIIIKLIDEYVKSKKGRVVAFTSLGMLKYLSLMKHVDVMLGNSSSGIIEMPSFGKPTINVGDRQKGRIVAKSVIQCASEQGCIKKALKMAFSRKFNRNCAKVKNPYDGGLASKKIIAILKKELPKIKSLKKKFYDYV